MAVLFFLLLLFISFVSPAVSQAPLTLNERIQAQEKIERVYYNHRMWPETNRGPKPPFEQMVPRSVSEQKVMDSLKKSEALTITPKILQAEMNRMAETTQDPSMLRELFTVLDNNPFLIAEILARPALVDRMMQDKNFAIKNNSRKSSARNFRLPEINGGSSCEGWEPLTASNPPSARSGHTAVWTGAEMIIWGGAEQNTGGRYDPALNIWTPTSTGANVPSGRSDHTAVWTGTEMIIWGGAANFIETNTGGRYNPTTDAWTPTSVSANVPNARSGPTAVWTGSEMIVWGGEVCCPNQLNTGGRYDPSSDSWQPTSLIDAPSPRTHHTAVWTEQEMIVWGGFDGFSPLETGGRYDPVSDTWFPTSFDNAPIFRHDHTAVWTGTEMIIWGGNNNGQYESGANTGSRYDPISDTWQPTSTFGAPLQRGEHTAVWTGTEMIIWSGNFWGWNMKIGGRYSPLSDNWAGTAIGPNAPEGRSEPTTIWTGTKMIVWGGYDVTSDLNTGGIYSPDTDNITLNPVALPNAEIGTAYLQTISASGGVSPYSMEIVEGSLSWFKPELPGRAAGSLKFDQVTGILSGSPGQENFAQFAVTATDANLCAGSQSYYFLICPVITFSPLELPTGTVGFLYTQIIVPSGGLSPYLFSITTGSLPPGLTLNSSTGMISGTPTTLGSFSFTLNAVDQLTCAKNKDYTIKVNTLSPSPHN